MSAAYQTANTPNVYDANGHWVGVENLDGTITLISGLVVSNVIGVPLGTPNAFVLEGVFTDANGLTLGLPVDGSGNPIPPLEFAWSNRGDVSRLPLYTPAYCYDLGEDGSLWFNNGSDFNPVGGSIVLTNRSGSRNIPLASRTGAGLLVPSPGPVKIPADLLRAGRSQLLVSALFFKSTATATGEVDILLGTANDGSDPIVIKGGDPLPAGGGSVWLKGELYFDLTDGRGLYSTALNATYSMVPNFQSATWGDIVRASQIDTRKDMYVNFSVATGADAGDTFKLLAYRVEAVI